MIKATQHKTPAYWMGWALLYVRVLKRGVDPTNALYQLNNPAASIAYVGLAK